MKTLTKMLQRNLDRDPLDGPVVDTEAAIMAQELRRELDWADEHLAAGKAYSAAS